MPRFSTIFARSSVEWSAFMRYHIFDWIELLIYREFRQVAVHTLAVNIALWHPPLSTVYFYTTS